MELLQPIVWTNWHKSLQDRTHLCKDFKNIHCVQNTFCTTCMYTLRPMCICSTLYFCTFVLMYSMTSYKGCQNYFMLRKMTSRPPSWPPVGRLTSSWTPWSNRVGHLERWLNSDLLEANWLPKSQINATLPYWRLKNLILTLGRIWPQDGRLEGQRPQYLTSILSS